MPTLLVEIMPREPVDLDEVVKKASQVHKLLGVHRDVYLDFNQFLVQLNLSANDGVRLLLILSGVNPKTDLTRDARVREVLRSMGKRVPQ